MRGESKFMSAEDRIIAYQYLPHVPRGFVSYVRLASYFTLVQFPVTELR